MKKCIVLALALFWLQSFSQPSCIYYSKINQNTNFINNTALNVCKLNTDKELLRYRKLKVSGITFTTIGGVGLIATGIVASFYNNVGNLFHPLLSNSIGSYVIMVGGSVSIPFLAIGLPQLGIGIKRSRTIRTF
ncbi:MAG: hypothetical protein K1X55_08060 [Chitinophagales bacterium]|nr:hypothetical protein [Chitinophagales bacterium]